MTLADLRALFRAECPECPTNVVTDAQVNAYFLEANLDFCTKTRCIVDQEGTSIVVAKNDTHYDLTSLISNFLDIDEFPGGGVVYNNKRIDQRTMGELDKEDSLWRNRIAGTPKRYFRRGQYLYLDRPVGSASDTLLIYSVLQPTAFTGDSSIPLNGLAYLYPYQIGLLYYVEWRAKARIAKAEESTMNLKVYVDYAAWVKKDLTRAKFGPITMRREDSVNN